MDAFNRATPEGCAFGRACKTRQKMNFTKVMIAGALALTTIFATGAAQAVTVTLADGVLAPSGSAPNGDGVQQTLGAAFDGTGGVMTFSGTLDNANLGGGGRNIGMTVGNVYFLVHPGFSGSAFRYDAVNLGTGFVDAGAYTSNINIGYTVNATAVDIIVALTSSGTNYDFDVTINQAGVGSYMNSFTLAKSAFGFGGAIDSFGAFHNATSGTAAPLAYSGFSSSVAAVPLPAALPLLLAGLSGLGMVGRRRKI